MLELRSPSRRLLLLFTLLLSAGCGEGVQEDRSINYASDGGAVAFHHGDEGVFVASADGVGLERIYDTAGTIATSSPLWSPVDRRLIFTVARPADDSGPGWGAGGVAWDANPEGRVFRAEPIVYDCLLRPAPSTGEAGEEAPTAEPTRLFRAACDHAGYVAANLAVRWHPDGTRVLFVDRVPEGGVSLFEFEIASRTTRRVLPRRADALVFEFSPGGNHLCCVLGHHEVTEDGAVVIGQGADPTAGVWVQTGDDGEWWQVPNSGRSSRTPESSDLLERLRSMRPAWTTDDQRFVCIDLVAGDDEESPQHTLLEVDVAARTVESRYRTTSTVGDLQWSPDGERLGFIESPGGLRLLGPDGSVAAAAETDRVRRFAGWNHDGTRLAWIVPEPNRVEEHWALLFPPVPDARDHVLLSNADASLPPKVVHEGMRITFPQWSPTEDTLSLWGTYAPTHRSLLSLFVPWSLQPGDPAAILDGETGEMHWMAINAREEAQVGHYYLLKRDYERAWEWYERSAGHREPAGPIKLAEMSTFLRGMRVHDEPSFFAHLCLAKLDRPAEAALRLRRFREAMRIDLEPIDETMVLAQAFFRAPPDTPEYERLRTEVQAFADDATPWLRNAYAAEVFLSLGAADDGAAFFRREHEAATSDAERLTALLCLSQMLLVEGDRAAYVDVVIDELVPLMMSRIDDVILSDFPVERDPAMWRGWTERYTALIAGGIAALPLLSDDFLDGFTAVELETQRTRWEATSAAADGNERRLVPDLFLLAIHAHSGNSDEWTRVRERMLHVPPAEQVSSNTPEEFERNVDQMIEQLRGLGGR